MISAFLFHAGGNEDPSVILANANKSFKGSDIYGTGFVFDDSELKATPVAEIQRLIEQNPKNAERIFPYIGGEEVNSSPTHSHHRHVINFGDMSEEDARIYPDLMKIIEEKVKPERIKNNRETYRRYWWQYAEKRPGLIKAIEPLKKVLVTCIVSKHLSFVFLSKNIVFAKSLFIFPLQANAAFCTLQSRYHEVWARFFSSTLEDRLAYRPSDCFETFPFPKNWETNSTLEAVGKKYYDYRAALMVRNNQGLTDTYNRFHDPDEGDSDILKLRELHAQMDRAVLNAYGWADIPNNCEFILDHADEDDENSSGRQKKPWRYRWPEEIHDEVLARLLELNQERAEEERLAGTNSENKTKQKKGIKKGTKSRKALTEPPTIPNFPSTSAQEGSAEPMNSEETTL